VLAELYAIPVLLLILSTVGNSCAIQVVDTKINMAMRACLMNFIRRSRNNVCVPVFIDLALRLLNSLRLGSRSDSA
jgi:hypothetical protein